MHTHSEPSVYLFHQHQPIQHQHEHEDEEVPISVSDSHNGLYYSPVQVYGSHNSDRLTPPLYRTSSPGSPLLLQPLRDIDVNYIQPHQDISIRCGNEVFTFDEENPPRLAVPPLLVESPHQQVNVEYPADLGIYGPFSMSNDISSDVDMQTDGWPLAITPNGTSLNAPNMFPAGNGMDYESSMDNNNDWGPTNFNRLDVPFNMESGCTWAGSPGAQVPNYVSPRWTSATPFDCNDASCLACAYLPSGDFGGYPSNADETQAQPISPRHSFPSQSAYPTTILNRDPSSHFTFPPAATTIDSSHTVQELELSTSANLDLPGRRSASPIDADDDDSSSEFCSDCDSDLELSTTKGAKASKELVPSRKLWTQLGPNEWACRYAGPAQSEGCTVVLSSVGNLGRHIREKHAWDEVEMGISKKERIACNGLPMGLRFVRVACPYPTSQLDKCKYYRQYNRRWEELTMMRETRVIKEHADLYHEVDKARMEITAVEGSEC